MFFHLKIQIAVHEGIPHFQHEFMLDDKFLNDRLTLTEVGMHNDMKVRLVVCNAEVTCEQCIVCGCDNNLLSISILTSIESGR
jgi:hypothetical protein